MHRTDPQLSTAKRQQRTHALNTTLSQAALARRLAAAEERDTTIERFEADRRWLAEHEQEEREEKERLSKEREEEKVSGKSCRLHFPLAHLTRPYLLCR
jgi:mitotic spindle assembly checkpoint protein MAD1